MRDYVRLHTSILLRRLAYQLNHAAKSGDADAIHDLRVAIRRLSGCLRLFARFYPGHSAKRIRRRLGDLMELAGAVRNLDITLELLGNAGVPAKAPLAASLRDRRRKACAQLEREVRLWKNRAFSRKWRSRLEL